MAEKSGFFNSIQLEDGSFDRPYYAEDFAAYFSRFISNGVYPNPSTGLQVVASEIPDMNVHLSPGYAYINGYTYENTSDLIIPIDVADGVLNRRTSIFIRFDLKGRIIGYYKQEGTPSTEPSAPEPQRTTDYHDLCVAIIHVNAGVTAIDQSLIEDTRMDSELCGIVHGVIEQVDPTTLYLQVQKDLENFRTVSQGEFDEWFESVKGTLSGDVAGNLLLMIQELQRHVMYKYSAIFKFDAWTGEGPYTQTVALVPKDGGPEVTADFQFASPPWCGQVSDDATRETLLDILGSINNSNCTLGDGTITSDRVSIKPTADIEVFWFLKKGGV